MADTHHDPKSDVRTERAFLHAVSSPLSAAHIHLSGILEDVEARESRPSDAETDVADRLRLALASLDRVMALIQGRRGVLVAAAENEHQTS